MDASSVPTLLTATAVIIQLVFAGLTQLTNAMLLVLLASTTPAVPTAQPVFMNVVDASMCQKTALLAILQVPIEVSSSMHHVI